MEKDLVPFLEKHSGKPADACLRALEKHDGDFWRALHELTVPEEGEDFYLDQLDPAAPEVSCGALERLGDFYGTKQALHALIHDDELAALVDGRGYRRTGRKTSSEREVKAVLSLLSSPHHELVERAVRYMAHFDARQLKACVPSLKALLHHPYYPVPNAVLSLFPAIPDEIPAILPELEALLACSRKVDLHHFSAIRLLWDENVPCFPALLPLVEKLHAWTRNAQTKSMAKDVLVKHRAAPKGALEAREAEQRAREVASIHKKVRRYRSAKGLHAFAAGFNWDDDLEHLKAVIEHPKCDLGTARLIFWRARPAYYLKYAAPAEAPESEREVFALLLDLEARVREGRFPTSDIPYDPRDDEGMDFTEGLASAPRAAGREVPDGL